jgi:hypothetical protein
MIVSTPQQFNEVMSRMNEEHHLHVPIYSDAYYHRVENDILCVGVIFEDQLYVVSVSHNDVPTFDIQPTEHSITPKQASAVLYEQQNTVPELHNYYTPYINETLHLFERASNINRVIPIAVWADVINRYTRSLPISRPSDYMVELIDVLEQIENSGLCVDTIPPRSFKGNFVYSEYNPFTTTGRPSNRFGGINFSALNKTDGSRDAYISRYENGTLVQMDFEAYHLRLISEEFDIKLPTDESIHEMFAKIYFNTDTITEELYEESKKKTFEILYGITPNDYGIELFQRIRQFRNSFQNQDSVKLPSGITVEVFDPSPSKLFNYYIQSLEMVKTLPKLKAVLELLRETSNHLTLYTYDSILLDMETYDQTLVDNIRNILEENNKFPVRIYRGSRYSILRKTV